jgi:hypothetical protein
MAGTIVLSSAYGIDVVWEGMDPWIAIGERSQDALSMAARPGAYLVDSFPWMKYIPKWMPGAGFQQEALTYKKDIDYMPEETMKFVRRTMVSIETSINQ